MSKRLFLTVFCVVLCVSACTGSGATSTPAPTLTAAPVTGTAPPNARLFTILDDQSVIHYTATLAIGGIQIGGTFAIKGKTITMVPENGGYRLNIDVQIDGNSVTGANSLVVNALKSNMETDKFPYGHFIAQSKDVVTPGTTAVQTIAVGTVELHGQTQPIAMPISFTLINGKIVASGATTLDLLPFGVHVPLSVMKSVITFKADLAAQEATQP